MIEALAPNQDQESIISFAMTKRQVDALLGAASFATMIASRGSIEKLLSTGTAEPEATEQPEDIDPEIVEAAKVIRDSIEDWVRASRLVQRQVGTHYDNIKRQRASTQKRKEVAKQ